MALSWTLSLKDRMSDPAAKGARALKALEAGLKRVREEEARQARLAAIVARDTGKRTETVKHLSAAEVKSAAIRKAHYGAGLQMASLGKKQQAIIIGQTKQEQTYQKMLARRKHFANDSYAKKSGVLNFQAPYSDPSRKASKATAGRPMASGGGGESDSAFGISGGTIALAAAAASAAALRKAWDFTVMIGEAQEFKSSTLYAFEQITKTKAGAQAAYDLATKTALDVGADFKTSMSSMNSLMAQGFDTQFADQLIRAMADLSTINPMANMEGITRAISQIKTTGKLQGDEMMQLAEAGLNVGDVYKQIAKQLGIVDKNGKSATEQVQKLQAAGKIKSDTAITAIMATIKDQVGGQDFGAVAAKKADGSLRGMIARLMTAKELMLQSVKIDWSPVSRAIERIQAAMASPAGTRMMDRIGASISMLLGKLDGVSQSDMEEWMDRVGSSVTAWADALDRSVSSLTTITSILDRFGTAQEKASGMSGWDLWLKSVGSSIELIIWPMRAAISVMDSLASVVEGFANGGLSGGWEAIKGVGSGIYAWAAGLVASAGSMLSSVWASITEAATSLGSDTVNGIIAGIESGAAGIVDALVGAVNSAITAAEEALGIASPSRVMRVVGRFTAKGMARGIDDETKTVAESGYRMAASASAAGSAVGSAASSSSRQTATTNTSSRNTVVNNHFSGGTAEENARAFSGSMRTLSLGAG